MKSTTNSIAVSGRREREMFEVWFLQETLDIEGSPGMDHLIGCHAVSSSLSKFGKQQAGRSLGRNPSMNASGKYPACHERSGIMPVAKKLQF